MPLLRYVPMIPQPRLPKHGTTAPAPQEEGSRSSARTPIDAFTHTAKRKARELREELESRKRYEALAEAIPQIVWTSTPEGYIDFFNRRWFEYTGLTEEETYQQKKSILHPDDLDRYSERWNHALRTGETYVIEYRFRRASDGAYRWHLGRAVPIRDEHGRIVKWFGTSTDIDDQKKLEERIRRANEFLEEKVKERTKVLEEEIERRKKSEWRNTANLQRLQSVMASMHMGAVLSDEHQKIISVNKRFCELFDIKVDASTLVGMHAGELIQKVISRLRSPTEAVARLQQAIAAQKPQMNVEVQLKSGTILTREYVPIAVEGQLRGHLVLYRDVTMEKRIDASKSEFMSLASHQLRTPLTSVRWVLGKLARMLDGKISDNERHLLTEGKKATMRMAATIDTMLTISRIESGKVSLKLTDIHLASFFQELAPQFQAECERRNVSLAFECPDHLFAVTDSGFFGEVMRNLIGNAIKYNCVGGSVRVRVEEHEQRIFIAVSDTGQGIPRDQHGKIFSKFFRASNVVNDDTEGSGLGLYLVHLLVTILGGTITFTSEQEAGTEFHLLLPTVSDPT